MTNIQKFAKKIKSYKALISFTNFFSVYQSLSLSLSFGYYQTTSVGTAAAAAEMMYKQYKIYQLELKLEPLSIARHVNYFYAFPTIHHPSALLRGRGGAFVLHTMGAGKCFGGVLHINGWHKNKNIPGNSSNLNEIWPDFKGFCYKLMPFTNKLGLFMEFVDEYPQTIILPSKTIPYLWVIKRMFTHNFSGNYLGKTKPSKQPK